MVKSSSTKLMRLLGLLLSLFLLCFTYACSNDAESVESRTEAGGAAYGVHIASLTGTPMSGENLYSAMAGQSIILTAKVTDSADNPVRNADVYFQFTSNESGATLTLGNTTGTKVKSTTDAGGQAIVVYKAGAFSSTSELEDVVVATHHDSKMAATITRKAGSLTSYYIRLDASTDNLKAGESSIITASVSKLISYEDKDMMSMQFYEVPVSGQAVNFSFINNNSGGTLKILGTGTTDGEGKALAIYTAGNNKPSTKIQDTMQASTSESSGSVIITRLANTAIIGCRLTLTADRTSLDGGKSTILRATVLNGDGKPYTGNVKFEFLTNISEGTLSPASAQTNSNGIATTVYKAGTEGTGAVEDIIKASATQCCTGDDCCTETLCCTEAGCCSETIIITRAGQPVVTPTGYRITMTAGKNSLTAGETTIVTAKVTDGSSVPVKGQVVNFSFVSNPSGGSLSTISGTTDASGEAIAGYTAGSNTPTVAVQDIIQASVTGATGAIILARPAGGASQTGLVLTLTPTATSVTPGNTSLLTARIVNGDNEAVSGLMVTFEFSVNNSTASLLSDSGTGTTVTGTTDGAGKAIAVYTAGTVAPTEIRLDTIRASVTGASDVVVITRAPNPGPENKVLTLTQNPATSPDARVVYNESSTVLITATVTRNGLAWPTEPITFSVVSGLGNIVSAASETDANGRAEATFELPIGLTTPVLGTTVIAATIAGEGGSPIIVHTPVYWAIWYYGP
ncbi:MAG: Ig-like domain-containing protein [Smithella sp.]